ncbi:MAG TPA: hypothetical protein VGT82_05380 [Ktedonobacteraceae bacterium]|nr:hypothetical protein [Ktedonobacteraceae bacterium]
MSIALLLTSLFLLLMLGLLVATVYSMVIIAQAMTKSIRGQQRSFTASILNSLTLPQ